MNYVLDFIRSLNINNKCVVVALSGGPDSMLLLNLLLQLREELNIEIIAAHVHHNLRDESDSEAKFVKEYCGSKNVIFEFMKIEKYPDNKFSEDAARKIRYDFFKDVIDKYNADILFTAHHADDLMETILMRLTRGSNLKGYAGFRNISYDKGYKIAKPLIYLQKSEIIEYLDNNNIKYVIDMSNKLDEYTRNRYRNHIVPKLKLENVEAHKKFIKFSQMIYSVSDYINNQATKIKDEIIVNGEIIIDKFNSLDYVLKIELIHIYLKEIYKDHIGLLTDNHVNIILNNIKKANVIFDMPLNKKFKVEYNRLKVVKNTPQKKYDYVFDKELKLPNGRKIVTLESSEEKSNFITYLDSNEISMPIHVRCRKPNDKIIVKNMNHHKKVNDIFTDEKVLSSIRDTYPIVVDSNDTIIWIPGIKKSKFDKKNSEKYDIILKYI